MVKDRLSQCIYEMSLSPQIPLFQLLQTARYNEGDQGPADQQSSKSKTTQTDIGGDQVHVVGSMLI